MRKAAIVYSKTISVFQKGGDVVEIDARLGKIRHFADELLEVVGRCGQIRCVSGHAAIVARLPSECPVQARRTRYSRLLDVAHFAALERDLQVSVYVDDFGVQIDDSHRLSHRGNHSIDGLT